MPLIVYPTPRGLSVNLSHCVLETTAPRCCYAYEALMIYAVSWGRQLLDIATRTHRQQQHNCHNSTCSRSHTSSAPYDSSSLPGYSVYSCCSYGVVVWIMFVVGSARARYLNFLSTCFPFVFGACPKATVGLPGGDHRLCFCSTQSLYQNIIQKGKVVELLFPLSKIHAAGVRFIIQDNIIYNIICRPRMAPFLVYRYSCPDTPPVPVFLPRYRYSFVCTSGCLLHRHVSLASSRRNGFDTLLWLPTLVVQLHFFEHCTP